MVPWVIGTILVAAIAFIVWGFRRLYKQGGFKSLIGILEHLAFLRGINPSSMPGKFRGG